jgi:tyrosinase
MWNHFFAASAALLALLNLTTATPVQKRQNSVFAINGGAGGVQQRLEIRTMQANADMWNLFLAALQEWQAMDESDKLSYYQVGGIHGQPLVDWDGVASTGDRGSGYCPHNSNMFGPWHRPYLALVEQLIQQHAINIANALPDGDTKTKFQGIAQQLRLPYWDWAMLPPSNGPILPDSVTSQNIAITYPNGSTATIANPLFQYTFHPLRQGDLGPPFDKWTYTCRGVSDLNNPNTPSNNGVAQSNLANDMNNRRSTLYQILTQYQSYNLFSNHGSGNSPVGNLESIHDGIHAAFGQSHMLYLTVSAFDFVFFLHHANVDRILAIFQKLYPDTYVEAAQQPGSTYMYARGSTQDANSQLGPFHSDSNGDIWTPSTSRDITKFSYTYPELAGNPSNDSLKAIITGLYNSAPSSTKRGVNRMSNWVSSPSENDKPRAYIVGIRAPLTALDGPYSIRVFLGDPTTDVSQWRSDKMYVGSMAVMAKAGYTDDDAFVSGSVPLTQKLDDLHLDNILEGLDQNTVLTHLKGSLRVKIVQVSAHLFHVM